MKKLFIVIIGLFFTAFAHADCSGSGLGHDMCSGAFEFDESDNYEVEFSFMDMSGNISAWSGERIKFTKPT